MVKKTLITTSLKYGLAGGIIIIAPFLVLLKMDLKPLINLNTLILEGMLMFIFIYFGLKEYREKRNQGILKFWEGMTMGFMIYLCIALLSAVFLSAYVYLIDPDYIITYRQDVVEYVNDSMTKIDDLEEKKLLSDQLNLVEGTKKSDLVIDSLTKKILLGLIFTPICTVFLRRY